MSIENTTEGCSQTKCQRNHAQGYESVLNIIEILTEDDQNTMRYILSQRPDTIKKINRWFLTKHPKRDGM